MKYIAEDETSRVEPHESSFWPKSKLPSMAASGFLPNGEPPLLTSRDTNLTTDGKATSSDLDNYEGFHTCHYFDLIGGTSTGGYDTRETAYVQ
jgi:hypothetical protein